MAVRLTFRDCKNCGHQHRQFTSTGEWERAAEIGLIYTTGCIDGDCDCKKFESCACQPTCSTSCRGECGCVDCHDAYQDFLSLE